MAMFQRDINRKRQLAEMMDKQQRFANVGFREAQEANELQKRLLQQQLQDEPSWWQNILGKGGDIAGLAGMAITPFNPAIGLGLATGGMAAKSLAGSPGAVDPSQLAMQLAAMQYNKRSMQPLSTVSPTSSYSPMIGRLRG